MTVEVEPIKAFQANLSSKWTVFREIRKSIVDRDSAIVSEFRDYVSEVLQTVLRTTGETLTADMSDRFIDVENRETRIVVTFRTEEFRNYKFKPLSITLTFNEGSVSVQGGHMMGRKAEYYLPEFNIMLQKHLQPSNLEMVVAGDFSVGMRR